MEIVKPGVLPSSKVCIGTCTHCNGVVRATRGECVLSMDRNSELYAIRCPTRGCNAWVTMAIDLSFPPEAKTSPNPFSDQLAR